ncbi:MAG TPA: AarF/ABC1/UbiB kinase family protein [Thermoanaerobaculia bacterium]|nr:AarF/ABC1/UbiB kinase family protein [Thermoanaerobaculia bacterium]
MITSPLRRLLRLGGLVGRIGVSLAGEGLRGLAGDEAARAARRRELLVRNAARIVETLGELKGAAMKVGQMLSLHEAALPPEVTAVLRGLQREAPRLPFEIVGYELDAALPGWRQLFREIEPEAFAAASIGQVHRATLADGRPVVVKVQYPLIAEVIEADLDNLRLLLETLFALVSETDFEPVWNEVRDRLREEIDYRHEAENARRLAALHAAVPEIVVPAVIAEASARRVITCERVEGLSADEACADGMGQAERDRWGRTLFEFLLRGLFRHRLLHADPNLANFAFLPGGRLAVYDFGCVKEVPPALAHGYAALTRAVLAGHVEEIPPLLAELGVCRSGGEAVGEELVRPYAALFAEAFRPAPPYRFGEDDSVYRRLFSLGWENLDATSDIVFPADLLFVNRTVGGHFGNLSRLRAAGPWREILRDYVAE